MSEPSYDWEFEKRLAIIVMPISTIGVIVSLFLKNSVGVLIFFVIGTLSVFLLNTRAKIRWGWVIIACALIGFVMGLILVPFVLFTTGWYMFRWLRDVIFEEKQQEKGLKKYIRDEDGEVKWGTPEEVKEWKEFDIGLSTNFENYTPRAFEFFIRDLFTKMGYDAVVTQQTVDGGGDVIAKKPDDTIVIEVKHFSEASVVDSGIVLKTLGAMGNFEANRAIVVTNSRFSGHAQKVVGRVELWDKVILHEKVREYMI